MACNTPETCVVVAAGNATTVRQALLDLKMVRRQAIDRFDELVSSGFSQRRYDNKPGRANCDDADRGSERVGNFAKSLRDSLR